MTYTQALLSSKWKNRWYEVLNKPDNQKKIKEFRFARSLYMGNKDKYEMEIRKSDTSENWFSICLFKKNASHNIWRTATGPMITPRKTLTP